MDLVVDANTAEQIVKKGTRELWTLQQVVTSLDPRKAGVNLLIGVVQHDFIQDGMRDGTVSVWVGGQSESVIMSCISPLNVPGSELKAGQFVLVLQTTIGNIIIGADCEIDS